jgi:hypothetical protein
MECQKRQYGRHDIHVEIDQKMPQTDSACLQSNSPGRSRRSPHFFFLVMAVLIAFPMPHSINTPHPYRLGRQGKRENFVWQAGFTTFGLRGKPAKLPFELARAKRIGSKSGRPHGRPDLNKLGLN